MLKDFVQLLNDTNKVRTNLIKDNSLRRKDINVLNVRKLEYKDISDRLKNLRNTFVSNDVALVKEVQVVIKQIETIKLQILDIIEKRVESNNIAMEKFDLKTASSLLPTLNDKEDVTKQLIDAIEFYADIIELTHHPLLIKFILKSRLSQNAKLKMQSAYDSIPDLITDMRRYLLTRKSPMALSSALHNSKQRGKSIDEFGKHIETLLSQLTLAQAEDDVTAIPTLQRVNEKIAINVFSNGLNNKPLQTIIKAQNFSSLNQCIASATDEEKNSSQNEEIYYYANKKPFNYRRQAPAYYGKQSFKDKRMAPKYHGRHLVNCKRQALVHAERGQHNNHNTQRKTNDYYEENKHRTVGSEFFRDQRNTRK